QTLSPVLRGDCKRTQQCRGARWLESDSTGQAIAASCDHEMLDLLCCAFRGQLTVRKQPDDFVDVLAITECKGERHLSRGCGRAAGTCTLPGFVRQPTVLAVYRHGIE